MPAITVRGSSEQVREAIRELVSATASGSSNSPRVLSAAGQALLSKIQQAFLVKAQGGTDEAGDSWPDLKPETKAYSRRFGPGEKKKLKAAAGLTGRTAGRGLMTPAQDRQWRAIYRSALTRLLAQGDSNPQKHAAQIAWGTMKKKGVKTALEVFGSRKVEILRDTGVLFNSLSAGGADNVFDVSQREVVIGTNVPYAKYHHHGKRPLWPEPSRWPASWREAVAAAAQQAVIAILQSDIGQAVK